MSEFTVIDLSGQVPEQDICAICAKTGALHVPTQTMIVYCQHKLRGAYRVLDRPWKILTGIERHHFRDVVARGLTAGELRVEIERDLLRILEEQGKGNARH